jgi:hypothetical protein
MRSLPLAQKLHCIITDSTKERQTRNHFIKQIPRHEPHSGVLYTFHEGINLILHTHSQEKKGGISN